MWRFCLSYCACVIHYRTNFLRYFSCLPFI
uniref:Uncharacterized protein n=1 Tax=Arundo donax TaxID=35708 RepID=A0A0A9CHM6_ARUDO